MKNIWLIYSQLELKKNKWYINQYKMIGQKLGLKIEILILEHIEFGIYENTWYLLYQGVKPSLPSAAIVRTIYPLLSSHLEYMNIPVFNNAKVAEICNDKAKTCQYTAKAEIPMISTYYVKKNQIFETLKMIKVPTVVKVADGHGGNQVILADPGNAQEVYQKYKKLFTGDTVFQPLIGKKHQDLRVYVLGKKVLTAVLRTAKQGFKSNFSLGGEVESYTLSQLELPLIEKIISLFEFGLVGIDFLIGDQGELIFNEIEDVVGARMLYQCMGEDYNLVEQYLRFIQDSLGEGFH